MVEVVVTSLLVVLVGFVSGVLGAVIAAAAVCSKLIEKLEAAEEVKKEAPPVKREDRQAQEQLEDASSRFTRNRVVRAWWIGESTAKNRLEE